MATAKISDKNDVTITPCTSNVFVDENLTGIHENDPLNIPHLKTASTPVS